MHILSVLTWCRDFVRRKCGEKAFEAKWKNTLSSSRREICFTTTWSQVDEALYKYTSSCTIRPWQHYDSPFMVPSLQLCVCTISLLEYKLLLLRISRKDSLHIKLMLLISKEIHIPFANSVSLRSQRFKTELLRVFHNRIGSTGKK